MQYRRIRSDREPGALTAVVLGLGLGVAAGFLLGELYAGAGGGRTVKRAIPWGRRKPPVRRPSEYTDDLLERLDTLLGADAQSFQFVQVGRNAIELHGWVTSRQSRTRAIAAARGALDQSIKLVDRLLVWGEDDRPTTALPFAEEPESA